MAFVIPNQTSTSLLRPVPTPSGWTRPNDWITITDTPGEVQFLMSDATTSYTAINTIFTQTGGVGNIYIDWGDGTTDTISSLSATTNHQYTSGGTPSSLGYNMWKIRVYGDAGTTLSNTSIVWNTNLTTLWTFSPSGILEAVYGDGTQTSGFQSLFYSALNPRPWFLYLTYVKLPSVINTAGDIFFGSFLACSGLRKIVMPTSAPNATSFNNTFNSCSLLSEPIILPQDALSITTFQSAFSGCYSLTSITLPPTLNNVVNMISAFATCYSLTQIEVPVTPLCLDYTSMLNNCRSLLSFEFKAFPTAPGTINMTNFLLNAEAIEYIKLPATTSGNDVNMNATFSTCRSLKNIVLPSNLNASNMTATFQNCSSLASVVLPTTMSGLTNMTQTFQLCGTLQQITLPTSVGATINMFNTFASCQSLSEITIPSSYNITNLSFAFQACFNLRKLTLPNNAQNSLTTMATMCDQCRNLQSVVMPTSMNLLNTLASTFNNCNNLQSIVFPSSLNLVTTMLTTFASCFNLQSVVMPTSMTSLTILTTTFQNCNSLKSIVLPVTTGNITSYQNCFANCYSLNNITLPTTPSTSLTTMNSTFNLDYSLTGITNTQFLGNSGTTGTIYVDFTGQQNFQLPSLDMRCKFSRFSLIGVAGNLTKLTSLRLRNNGAGQYAGSSPQVNIPYNSLGQAALVQVFNDLPTITSKTIQIVDNPGAALLTPAERAIATGKGWTIIG